MENYKNYQLSLIITLSEEKHKNLISKLNKMVNIMKNKGFEDYSIENAMQACLLIGCYNHIEDNIEIFINSAK